MQRRVRYSAEQIAWLEKNAPGNHLKDITEKFNEVFKTDRTVSKISNLMKRLKIKTGFTGRFEKGIIPINKGTKGLFNKGGNSTSFKPGNKPLNTRPVGSERFDKDGYLLVKIGEPNRWKAKHHLIWEEANGVIPKGHCLIFKDQDEHNITLDNLMLIERRELCLLNRMGWLKNDSQSNEAALLLVKLMHKIHERTKGKKKRKRRKENA